MLQFFVTIILVSKKITVLFKKATLQKNFVIVEAKLDGIDTDDTGHLEDLPRFVFIDKERKNLIVVNDGENLLKILTKRRSLDVTNAVGESISSVTMWNIVNQLGKHEFSCGSVVNNLKGRELVVIK